MQSAEKNLVISEENSSLMCNAHQTLMFMKNVYSALQTGIQVLNGLWIITLTTKHLIS